MAFEEIYPSSSNDGYCVHFNTNWDTARDATSSMVANNTLSSYNWAIRAELLTGRGGSTYYIARSFFGFDTSGIKYYPSNVQLMIYGKTYNSANVTPVKSTHGTTVSHGDYDAITGWQTGGVDNSNNVTQYASGLGASSWNTSGYNTFAINSTGKNDIMNNDYFSVCLMSSKDIRNVTPTGTSRSGCYYVDTGTSSQRPVLKVTLGAEGTTLFMGTNF